MNQEMYELATWSVKAAKAAGADQCKVSISTRRFVEISYRDRKPESIREASSRSLGIDVYVDQRYSGQRTSDLRRDALREFISNAVAATRLLARDPYRALPDPAYYKSRPEVDIQVLDPAHGRLTPEARHQLVRDVEGACLDAGGDRVISVTAEVYDSRGESVTVTSNGFEGYRQSTVFWAGAGMSAQDEGDRRPRGYNYLATVIRDDLPAAARIGTTAAARTLDLIGGKKLDTETLPIVVENRNGARLLGGFLAAMSGRNIQQKRSFLADMQGKTVGSSAFTLIDDPLIPRGLGSRLYDGDGFPARKRTMVANGALEQFYVDWYYSRKLGWEPTTGGASNLIIPPGKRSVEQIMKDLGRGIHITGFLGGNSNATTGDFSVGIIGQLFEDGQPVQAVAEMNIAGNHLEFWNRLAEVADDPWTYSSRRMPSLVFTDVVVSGV